MYEDCETQVTTSEGNTEYFKVKVGLHHGSAISPLLFITIMDVLAPEIDKEPPCAMLFADDGRAMRQKGTHQAERQGV